MYERKPHRQDPNSTMTDTKVWPYSGREVLLVNFKVAFKELFSIQCFCDTSFLISFCSLVTVAFDFSNAS